MWNPEPGACAGTEQAFGAGAVCVFCLSQVSEDW